MRTIRAEIIKNTVARLCLKANLNLRPDVLMALRAARLKERNKKAKGILNLIIENAAVAKKEGLAICQDTGLPYVFIEIGQSVEVIGDLQKAINQGIEAGYRRASLRASIVADPLKRDKPGYAPAIIHTEIVGGSHIKLNVLPKGFGCENKSQLKMFEPTVDIGEIKKFIIEAVKNAGPDACPPYIVGVGIGGTADYAAFLAKKALLRKIQNPKSKIQNKSKAQNSKLEAELLSEINRLDIGPMGLGGKTTCLGVNIVTYPTHIAGLPVAVNISCHALRSATAII